MQAILLAVRLTAPQSATPSDDALPGCVLPLAVLLRRSDSKVDLDGADVRIHTMVDQELQQLHDLLSMMSPPLEPAQHFWNAHRCQRFPTLASTIPFLFCVPATSVAAESSFNIAADVLSRWRGHTRDSTASARVACKFDKFNTLHADDRDGPLVIMPTVASAASSVGTGAGAGASGAWRWGCRRALNKLTTH